MGKKKTYSFSYIVHESPDALQSADKNLVLEALKAAENSYSPYSGFQVGAALLLENEKIFTGTNQENTAFPSGLCAERAAMFAAGNQFPDTSYNTLAVAAKSIKFPVTEPVQPCGACRQVMSQHEIKFDISFRVLLYGETGEVWEIEKASSLLPFSFHPKL